MLSGVVAAPEAGAAGVHHTPPVAVARSTT
jgi:hypothetical protein